MHKLGYHCHNIAHFEEVILANDLGRGEFYNFPADDVLKLKKEIRNHGTVVSIHAPLVRPDWYPDPPTWTFLCDVKKDKRDLTLRMIRGTLELAGEFEAEYVVVHYPSPVHDLDGSDVAELKKIAMDSAHQLSKMSQEYKTEIHIEGFGPSPFLNADFLIEVFNNFSELKYCFDTGHLNMESKERGLDIYSFASQIAQHVGSIHLWNNRGLDDYKAYRHIPVHPSQRPDEGWVDVESILKILWPHTKSVIFENIPHYPQELGDYDYKEGVQWVKQLAATLS